MLGDWRRKSQLSVVRTRVLYSVRSPSPSCFDIRVLIQLRASLFTIHRCITRVITNIPRCPVCRLTSFVGDLRKIFLHLWRRWAFDKCAYEECLCVFVVIASTLFSFDFVSCPMCPFQSNGLNLSLSLTCTMSYHFVAPQFDTRRRCTWLQSLKLRDRIPGALCFLSSLYPCIPTSTSLAISLPV